MWFELYRCDGSWRWRLVSFNGVVASSRHDYANKATCTRAVRKFAQLPFDKLPIKA